MTFWIINKIIAAYIISSLAFLIIILFFKTPRRRTNTFLNKANLIIAFVLVLNLIWVGEATIECLVTENSSSKTHAEETSTIYERNCTSEFIGTFFFAFLFQTLFFFNSHRTKVSFTIISILLLTFLYNYERLVIYIASFYRDYLPSSWTIYYDWKGILWTAFITVIYFALCWANQMTFKNKKLAGNIEQQNKQ